MKAVSTSTVFVPVLTGITGGTEKMWRLPGTGCLMAIWLEGITANGQLRIGSSPGQDDVLVASDVFNNEWVDVVTFVNPIYVYFSGTGKILVKGIYSVL